MQLSTADIELIKRVFSNKPVKRAFLFGSYARGEADLNSDVDILVALDYTMHIGLGFIKLKNQLEEALNKKVDLVSENSISAKLLQFINHDKKLIYER